jgi:hypothetical protein
MSLSKKDYEMIARVIRTNRVFNRVDRNAEAIIDNIVGDLAVALHSYNPNFDEDRFVSACEMPT